MQMVLNCVPLLVGDIRQAKKQAKKKKKVNKLKKKMKYIKKRKKKITQKQIRKMSCLSIET